MPILLGTRDRLHEINPFCRVLIPFRVAFRGTPGASNSQRAVGFGMGTPAKRHVQTDQADEDRRSRKGREGNSRQVPVTSESTAQAQNHAAQPADDGRCSSSGGPDDREGDRRGDGTCDGECSCGKSEKRKRVSDVKPEGHCLLPYRIRDFLAREGRPLAVLTVRGDLRHSTSSFPSPRHMCRILVRLQVAVHAIRSSPSRDGRWVIEG